MITLVSSLAPSAVVDVTPPTVTKVAADILYVEVTFSEKMRRVPQPSAAQVSLTDNGVGGIIVVSSTVMSSGTPGIWGLNLSTLVTSGDTISVFYTPSATPTLRLADLAGNEYTGPSLLGSCVMP